MSDRRITLISAFCTGCRYDHMPAAHQTSGRDGPGVEPGAHDLGADAAATIEWSVDAGGGLAFHGPAGEVLEVTTGTDLGREIESILAPILNALDGGIGWDDHQLVQTVERPGGPRQLMIRCRRQPDAGGGYVGLIMNAGDRQRVEENLGELIDRYRLLVEISPDMIVVHQQGMLKYINPTGLTLMGAHHVGDMVGRPLTDFVAPSSFGPLLERIAGLDHAGAVSTPSDLTAMTLDGRHLLLEAQSVRTTWDGRPAYQVFLRDHSERRRAEAAVRYQASLLASVSDAVLATDLDGRVTGWNPAAARLYGRTGSEALGAMVRDLLGADATTEAGRVRAGEVTHLGLDGSAIAVHVAVAPLRDEMGQLSGEVAICADQTYRLLAAAERRLAESRFTTVVTALTEGIVVIDSDGSVRSVNPAAQTLLGPDVTGGANALQLIARLALVDAEGTSVPLGHDPASLALATGRSQHNQVIGFDDDHGSRHWWSISCETLERGKDGQPGSIVCSITDVTERRASERRLTHAAAHDSLTGLANRTQLLNVLDECLAGGAAAAVLFVDLDRFKAINDTHGHLAGDRVLCTVASRILGSVESSMTVGRLAGDEFVLVMPDTDETAATVVAERIRDTVAHPIQVIGERQVVVTASIGIASTAAHRATAEGLLGDADMAMYRAKQRGRACIDVFDGALRAARSRRLDLADRLRGAILDHSIEVHYQPIVRFDSGETVGYEALARWTDPDLGPVPPDEFIPVAEDHGLIVALGKGVLLQACRRAATWAAAPGGSPPAISVNLSAYQLSDPHLPADVASVLAVSGLSPERLCLEVTESVLMDDVTASIAVLDGLRSGGVRLVIDDFGTGYSSLNYLRRLPVDGIKIDRSFVADLGLHADDDDAIVDAIIQLGHSLGLTITAEGVETGEQAAILRQLGCDTAQGHLYGRPVPAEALLTGASEVQASVRRSQLTTVK